MSALGPPLLCYLAAIVVIFSAYGLHRWLQIVAFLRTGGLGRDEEPRARWDELPPVTVQIPMFNERHVAERVIRAACALDYPRELLQVQVLDDSTDECAEIARSCCALLAAKGHDVVHLHRAAREGYKAGALAEGLRTARGELIAIFDADFVPPPDALLRTVHHFTDESLGMVQMRWTHLNRNASLLTRLQALCLDGHFVVEQCVRARRARWFNFNGTAGVWRRRAIEAAGGWQHDTLTEDTDLSYRAQLAGWRFRYLSNVTCPAELPPTLLALMSQQHRWNKGLVQTAIKLMPAIAQSRAPLATKIDAWFHLTSPIPYAAMLLLNLLLLPACFINASSLGAGADAAIALALASLVLGTTSAAALFVVGRVAQGGGLLGALGALLLVPLVMAIGIGLSLLNTRAIVEAMIGRASPFVRTPKYAGRPANRAIDATPAASAGSAFSGLPELAFAALVSLALVVGLPSEWRPIGAPFLALFIAGWLIVGLSRVGDSLRSALDAGKRRDEPRRAEASESA